jgi:hypothetical protein
VFEHTGWRAVSISNPGQPPRDWHVEWLDVPENDYGMIVSGSAIRLEDHVYAFGVQEPDHTVHLARWPVAQMASGDPSRPQWWTGGEEGWVVQQDLTGKPIALFSEGQNEFMVHYEPLFRRFVQIQSVGFGRANFGFRRAETPTGPWTPIERFYRHQEWDTPYILIYAAKAHPHLMKADLILTYATNTARLARLVRRNDLYYPRFLRVDFWKVKTNGHTGLEN